MTSALEASLDNPLLEHLGVRLVGVDIGRCVLELDLEPRHLNRQGSLHGGVIATLLDAAGGYAGLKSPQGPLGHAVTVMLNIAYLSKVAAGRVRAEGLVTRTGRSLYFAAAELATAEGVLVATAQGTFKRKLPSQET